MDDVQQRPENRLYQSDVSFQTPTPTPITTINRLRIEPSRRLFQSMPRQKTMSSQPFVQLVLHLRARLGMAWMVLAVAN